MIIDISIALDIEGWMSKSELLWLAEQASKYTYIVEIGSYKGRSTCALAANTRGTVIAIDTWPDQKTYDEFQSNIARVALPITPMRMSSVDAAIALYNKNDRFGMIFIDADHEYASVKMDILIWQAMVSDHGILCGHDRTSPGVAKAVKELLPKAEIAVDGIWVSK